MPKSDLGVPGYISTLASAVRAAALPFLRPPSHEVHVLKGINATLPAGKSTLILGAPGSGKSVLLRLIAARLRPDDAASLTFSGADAATAAAAGVDLRKLIAYAPQEVRE